ncbi:coiled-coil domain-containing protein 134 isoform X2 [Anabrus simplex]|uniref:coiled-coil domain-containing protein 134 isoform X2 n=1 Tax=Anabrus simplex TaxID=316456 RepID=UPI0035A2E054
MLEKRLVQNMRLTTKNVYPHMQSRCRLYIKRRAEQLDGVKRLLVLGSYEKQYQMVDVIVDNLFSVLQSSRVVLESSGYVPGISSFPTDEKVRDALANILENTALFGDILLHLPDISHRVLSSKHEWQVILQWSLGFTNQSQLIDKQTRVLVGLVSMELNLTERHPNYVNPYKRQINNLNRVKEEVKTVNSSKKKKEIKKGPRMSRVEL